MPALITRRSLFGGVAALLAAPAIVRVASIMPISVQPIVVGYLFDDGILRANEFYQFMYVTASQDIKQHDMLAIDGHFAQPLQAGHALTSLFAVAPVAVKRGESTWVQIGGNATVNVAVQAPRDMPFGDRVTIS